MGELTKFIAFGELGFGEKVDLASWIQGVGI